MKILSQFFLVTPSPWPLMTSISLLASAITVIMSIHSKFLFLPTITAFSILALSSFQWWRDIIREASFQGVHSSKTMHLLKMSMIMFITSEVFFFISFFWAFFHSSISPNIEIGSHWPPMSIQTFNPMSIPLLNSIILVSSGASITWSHHTMISKNLKTSILALTITIVLGIYFSMLQAFEYLQSSFSFSDSIYGSTFFITTGFHGIHVLIGSTFLFVTLIRLSMAHNSPNHIICMELSAWYWHFVDVVWLFLFVSIYWWGQ